MDVTKQHAKLSLSLSLSLSVTVKHTGIQGHTR